MNILTKIRNQNKITDRELEMGIVGGSKSSWHHEYSDSAWIYVGGIPYQLNEGDVIAVFSQYGEIVNINLVRDHKTGKSRGFAFICYEDQRSTILAVDNFNGIKLLQRTLHVDHVEQYKVPKYNEDIDEETLRIIEEGCAPKPIPVATENKDEERKDRRNASRKKGIVDKHGIIKVDKKLRKEMKKAKKEEKKRKKLEKLEKLIKEEPLDDISTGTSWKDQQKVLNLVPIKEEQMYGANKHFNFGKPKKEIPPPPTHNPRPDFENANWRDIEMWKAVREKEKLEKGEVQTTWKEEEHYLPQRFRRG